jgi:hypothetical protein
MSKNVRYDRYEETLLRKEDTRSSLRVYLSYLISRAGRVIAGSNAPLFLEQCEVE